MPRFLYHKSFALDVPSETVYKWYQHQGTFERLTPPWVKMRVKEYDGLKEGVLVKFQIQKAFFNLEWQARIEAVTENAGFTDRQVKGPFAFWKHEHGIKYVADNKCRVNDHVQYELPFGKLLNNRWGKRKAQLELARLFRYREEITRADLVDFYRPCDRSMTFLVTGATGTVGSALKHFLRSQGHVVKELSLTRPYKGAFYWDYYKEEPNREWFEGVDVVVHLAGYPIFCRWTAQNKKKILESRWTSTAKLADYLAKEPCRPPVFICASGINFYGTDRDGVLDEKTPGGNGFLAEVTKQWEEACDPLRRVGARVINIRTGMVLTPAAGGLAAMLPIFRLGLGGRIGSGKQMVSWIAIDDLVDAIYYMSTQGSIEGPVNVCAPESLTNKAFSDTLADRLGRIAILPLPEIMAKLFMGDLTKETVLANLKATPKVLLESGYRFRYPRLESALAHLVV